MWSFTCCKAAKFGKNHYNERLDVDETYAWTDSTTALAWIQSSPHRWATFVANRTSQIQDLTAQCNEYTSESTAPSAYDYESTTSSIGIL